MNQTPQQYTITSAKALQVNGLLNTVDPDHSMLPEYSGRGMYGNECLAFASNNLSAAQLGALVALALQNVIDYDIAIEVMTDLRSDQLGLGTVVYLPSLAVKD